MTLKPIFRQSSFYYVQWQDNICGSSLNENVRFLPIQIKKIIKSNMVEIPSSVRLGFCMSVILLVPRVVGVIIQNPSLILDVDA